MNSTKKITQGAMMIAILGALILIDRMTSFLFTELIVLLIPIIVIMYSAMNSFKDGLVVSAGILILSFILGNFYSTYLIYCPVGILTGTVYSYLLSKDKDRRTLMFSAIFTYVIGELLAMYIIYPLLGFPISQMIDQFKEMFNTYEQIGQSYTSLVSMMGLSFDKLLIILYLISTILMGAMEGILIHILTLFMFKRFKVKDIGTINIWNQKPNRLLSYIAMVMTFLMFIAPKINNETLTYVCFTLSIIGSLILFYYGYIFLLLYCKIVLRKNLAFLFILLGLVMPSLYVTLILCGFLYGAGPLRTYLENKFNTI